MKRILLLLLLLLALPLAAREDDPALARGFQPGAVFNTNDIDSINAFNGNLLITVPVGPEFQTSGALRYRFTAHYESNIWEHREIQGITTGDAGGVEYGQPRTYRWWDHNFIPRGEGDDTRGSETYPTLSNAGFGWWFGVTGRLSVIRDESGNLRPAYRTLDGVWHSLYPRLHGNLDNVAFSEWNEPVLFTRDGTYLRVRRLDNGLTYVVDRPDGIQEQFVCIADCSTQFPFYIFRQMSDAYGNVLWLSRNGNTWTYYEGTGSGPYPNHTGLTPVRSHRIVYKDITDDCTNKAAVDTVTLAMNGSAGGGSTYRFQYNHDALIYRSREMFWGQNGYMRCPFSPQRPDGKIKTSLLTAIESPEPLTDAGWAFEYIIEPDPVDYESDIVSRTWGPETWKASFVSGRLSRVVLPSGGAVGYKYERRPFRRVQCTRGFGLTVVGVRERQVYKRSGGSLVADGEPWRYFRGNVTPGGTFAWCKVEDNGTTIAAGEILSLTLDPLGNATAAMFEGLATEEFGQAYLPRVSDGEGRFLSTQTYQCSASMLAYAKGVKSLPPSDGTEPIDPVIRRIVDRYRESGIPAECGPPLRSTYVRYEDSGRWCGAEVPGDCTFSNRRVVSEKTVHHDDGNSTITTDYANFDGFGHYRESRSGGTLYQKTFNNGSGGDERRTLTNYNPGAVLNANGSMALPNGWTLATYPWTRLQTYDLMTVREQKNGLPFDPLAPATRGPAASTLYRFDDATGFLQRRRTLRKTCGACDVDPSTGRARCSGDTQCPSGTLLDPTDLLVQYERAQSAAGDVTITERYHGGDRGSLAPDMTLAQAIATTPDYIIRKEYDLGVVTRNTYLTCTLDPLLTTEAVEVHPFTGLVASVADSSGAATAYAYDQAFRLVTMNPPGLGPDTTYTYAKPTSAKGVEVTIAAGALRTSWVEYDSMGRLAVETSQVPGDDGALRKSVRTTSYHPNGWKLEESTPGPASRKGWTHYKSYDPFGRPTEIIHPDSGQGDGPRRTKYAYKGVRETEEEIQGVAVGGAENQSRRTYRFYDRFGRLVRVSEPSAGGDYAVTRYEYDPLDLLRRVDAPNEQVRLFDYDGRGFLTGEDHPELAGVHVRHGNYDARGHAGHLLYSHPSGPQSRFDRVLLFDGAERPDRIEAVLPPAQDQSPVLEQFVYHRQDGGQVPLLATERNAGKLQAATRYNWVPDVDAKGRYTGIPVTQSYTYRAAGTRGEGQVATRSTTVDGMTFDVAYSYDGLGNTTRITYPAMQRGTASLGLAREVNYTYTEGLLTAVPDFAWKISYHQNGLVSRVWHGTPQLTSAEDVFGLHPQSMTRPVSVETKFRATAPWTTGTYRYDAAGSVLSIGGTRESYQYDAVGRLTRAALPLGTQTFAYDTNGNLTEFAGAPVPVVAKTNRLLDAVYDEMGNVTSLTDARRSDITTTYEWDQLGMMIRNSGIAHEKVYVYGPANERVGVLDTKSASPQVRETWSIRGLGNEVLRDFVCTRTAGKVATPEECTWRDYIYRDGTLLAGVRRNGTADETIHYHLDHLGSVRRVSDASGRLLDQQDYFPFGEETVKRADDERMKFTSHERDDNGLTIPFGDVDYMHARLYAPTMGRFLSIDPVDGYPAAPQSWNRYAYVSNRPTMYVDPTGRYKELPGMVGDGIVRPQRCTKLCGGQQNDERAAARKRLDDIRQQRGAQNREAGINPDGEVINLPKHMLHPRTRLPMPAPDEERLDDLANFAAGMNHGSGGELLGQSILQGVGVWDEELQRQSALIDRDSKAYGGGSFAGFATIFLLSGSASGTFRVPPPSSPSSVLLPTLDDVARYGKSRLP